MTTIAQPQTVAALPAPKSQAQATKKSTKTVVTPGVSLLAGAVAGGVEATATVSPRESGTDEDKFNN